MLIQETNSHDLRIAMLPYTSALKLVDMYIDTIEEELFTYKSQNPIEHVKSRLKRPSSIARKLEKRGYEPTLENALKYIDDIAARRKTMVSTGDRSAKIRTYNYPQGRITDHRIGYTIYNLTAFMDGEIQGVIDALQVAENAERMKESEL